MPWNADVEWLKQHPDPRLVVGVAVDGSSIGDKALQAAVALHRERRADRVSRAGACACPACKVAPGLTSSSVQLPVRDDAPKRAPTQAYPANQYVHVVAGTGKQAACAHGLPAWLPGPPSRLPSPPACSWCSCMSATAARRPGCRAT